MLQTLRGCDVEFLLSVYETVLLFVNRLTKQQTVWASVFCWHISRFIIVFINQVISGAGPVLIPGSQTCNLHIASLWVIFLQKVSISLQSVQMIQNGNEILSVTLSMDEEGQTCNLLIVCQVVSFSFRRLKRYRRDTELLTDFLQVHKMTGTHNL
jgi:hypothetical protein